MQTDLSRSLAALGPALFVGCLGTGATRQTDADADIDADSDVDADSDSDTGSEVARPDADPAAPFALLELFTSEG